MPREAISFVVPDLSVFARSLARHLRERAEAGPPSHVEMLNLVARAAGHPNVQALRASPPSPAAPNAGRNRPAPQPLSEHASKALRQFDNQGRLVRWPSKLSVQRLAMWLLWMRFEPRRVYSEPEVNAVLKASIAFDDHVTLRRELVNHRLLARKSDCSEYRKLPARPDPEGRSLLAAWRARRRMSPSD